MNKIWFFVKNGYVCKVVVDEFDDEFVYVGGAKFKRQTSSTLYTQSPQAALHFARMYHHRKVRELLNQVEDVRQELRDLELKFGGSQ